MRNAQTVNHQLTALKQIIEIQNQIQVYTIMNIQ